jgi:predicted DNA-binding transcriptional regulator AlpA
VVVLRAGSVAPAICATTVSSDPHPPPAISNDRFVGTERKAMKEEQQPEGTPRSAESAFLTVEQLAVRWNLSRAQTYRTIKTNGFPAPLRFGTTLRYPLERVMAWENAQMGQAQ